jgi:hypothetical protein
MNAPHEINLTGSDDDVARWIWQTLVPKSGQAAFVQPEILRAIEKLRWEAQTNGNINWDDRFEMLIDFIEEKFTSQACLSNDTLVSIRNDLNRLRRFRPVNDLNDDSQIAELPYIDDDLYDRLIRRLIEYCRIHPQLVQHDVNLDQYR